MTIVMMMMMMITMVIVLVLQTLQCQCFNYIFSSHRVTMGACLLLGARDV
jgi:Tfp pilus assembly protein PilE